MNKLHVRKAHGHAIRGWEGESKQRSGKTREVEGVTDGSVRRRAKWKGSRARPSATSKSDNYVISHRKAALVCIDDCEHNLQIYLYAFNTYDLIFMEPIYMCNYNLR